MNVQQKEPSPLKELGNKIDVSAARKMQELSAGSPTKPLGNLSIEDVSNIMKNLQTGVSLEAIRVNRIDGEMLLLIETLSDVDELGLGMSKIRNKKFFSYVQEWRDTGVPVAWIV